MKKILLMCVAAGMLSSMACGKSPMGMCEENVEAFCEWDSKCNNADKKKCIESEKKDRCDEKVIEALETVCDAAKMNLENTKDTCSGESSSCSANLQGCSRLPECVK